LLDLSVQAQQCVTPCTAPPGTGTG